MHRIILFFVTLGMSFSLFTGKASAQSDYRLDTAFFYRQVPFFDKWIEENNLSSHFSFEENPLEAKEKNLTLNLRFKVSGVSTSINVLKQLDKIWIEKTGFDLEESLFQKAVFIFEVPPESLILRVRSIRDAVEGLTGVDSRLKYEKKYLSDTTLSVFEISEFSFLRSEVKDSTVIHNFELPEHISIYFKAKEGTHGNKKKERQICDYIKSKTEAYFMNRGEFESSFPISTNTINFGVKNLKNEVIEPGWVSNFDPYEKLSFSVKIVADQYGNMRVWLVVDGKYGPGLFKPRSGDYHEMFPKYKVPLEGYTSRFVKNYIRNWILEMPNRP